MKPGKTPRHSAAKLAARRGSREAAHDRTPAPSHGIDLPADCTARYAGQLRDVMLGEVDTSAVVRIAVGAVERIDTSCLQLLATFVSERGRNSRPVAWDGTSRAFSDAVALLGLASVLNASGAA